MRKEILLAICVGALVLPLAACNEQDTDTAEQTYGPSPALPPPQHSLIPTVKLSEAIHSAARRLDCFVADAPRNDD